ncbi:MULTISPECIES: hypothetical protein [unclassified Tolypothrix]|uniref:hypothetical protein n=1 Tax=unclassified Tolypothrix TaxID=2649714 RepID=UPI0012D73E9D|nr:MULTISPECIES: hypothetical protein [unclassified Tolypothrix]UYD32069.1 hypothetical protein HG267_23675 [Tolypothrix sp. PCC 7601]
MGHGKEHTNALCPMPQAAGQLSLSTHKGMEFPAAFNKTLVGWAFIAHPILLVTKTRLITL